MLQAMLPGVPVLNDVTMRVFSAGWMVAHQVGGQPFQLALPAQDLDLYTAGFMCSPYSKLGKRLGCQSEAAKTFFGVLKAIAATRPRAAIL